MSQEVCRLSTLTLSTLSVVAVCVISASELILESEGTVVYSVHTVSCDSELICSIPKITA